MYQTPEMGCDAILKGLYTQPAQKQDAFITKQVRSSAFFCLIMLYQLTHGALILKGLLYHLGDETLVCG